MTHAARTHDKLDELERMRDRLSEMIAEGRERESATELALLLADLSSFLRELDTRNFSDGKRSRLKGLKARLHQMRAA